jgi:methylenetetrahydrofolate dehydrogenase (NADP+)/methenyltetrahydrofolate cyclohydrolase
MKILNGQELADYIKERQAHEANALKSRKITPKLVIFYDHDNPVIQKYMTLKHEYGADIGVIVDTIKLSVEDAETKITAAANDPTVSGIIIQLPLKNLPIKILEKIPPQKDVDGLNGGYPSATAEAINWLLAGYNINLANQKIAIVGQGRLVGAPLAKMWQTSGYDITTFDKGSGLTKLIDFDIIVTATGVTGLITPAMLRIGATVIDAGATSEAGVIKGDLHPDTRNRQDLTITPKTGGVGPLTVTALFDHTLQAAKSN